MAGSEPSVGPEVVAGRARGRQAKRVVASLLFIAIGTALYVFREGIHASKPELNVPFLTGVAVFIAGFGAFFIVSVVLRSASGAAPLRADARGVHFQTPFRTVYLSWRDVERVGTGSMNGLPLLIFLPRSPSGWLKLYAQLPGGTPYYLLSGSEVDVPVGQLAAQLEALRQRVSA